MPTAAPTIRVRLLRRAGLLAAAIAITGCAQLGPAAGVADEAEARRELHAGMALYDKGDYVNTIRSLLTALKTHAHEHKLQVLITTADSELAHDVLPGENIIEAAAGKPLW